MNISTAGKARLLGLCAALATGATLPAAAQNLVANGGFEAGSLSGWSGSALASPYSGVYCPGAAPQGSCHAFLGTDGAADTLSQVLTTVAGQSYTISFTFSSDGGTPGSLSVTFGGQTLYSVTNPAAAAVQMLSFTATATAAATPLVFTYRDDPGYLILDAVSVTAVPEAPSSALAASGLAVLLLARRRGAAGAKDLG